MKIDVLVFEGCPNGQETWELVKRVASEEHPTAEVKLVDVADPEDSESLRFLGSPTVQVNGVDIEACRRSESTFSYSCRVYRTEQGHQGTPSEAMIRAAIQDALEATAKRT